MEEVKEHSGEEVVSEKRMIAEKELSSNSFSDV